MLVVGVGDNVAKGQLDVEWRGGWWGVDIYGGETLGGPTEPAKL